MKISERSQRLGSIIQAELPAIIQSIYSPEEVGFVTVSAVEVSGDLEFVDIFIRSIGGPKSTFAKLRRSEKKVAQELIKKINVRRVPIIRFKSDASVSYYDSIKDKFDE